MHASSSVAFRYRSEKLARKSADFSFLRICEHGTTEPPSQHLRQVRADHVASLVQRMQVALGTIALEVAAPLGQVALAAVLCDQLGYAVAAANSTRCPRGVGDSQPR
jgi:hypothetical protein